MHLCTTSDRKYLEKGLAMYQSLKTNCKAFTLNWLCLDKETFSILTTLNLENVKLYSLQELEEQHPELVKAKSNPPSQYGDAYSQYVWSLTPWFISYIQDTLEKWDDVLMYVDADIYFYQDPAILAQQFHDSGWSVGIHTHRFTGKYTEDINTGWYNVGVVMIKGDPIAEEIARTWAGWMLNPDHEHYKKYGTCGDQKYLELFEKLWPDSVCVFDQEFEITHMAPWCAHCEDMSKLFFYHFSHFTMKDGQWSDHVNEKPEWLPAADPKIKPLYERYFEIIKQMISKIEAASPQPSPKEKEESMQPLNFELDLREESPVNSTQSSETLEPLNKLTIEPLLYVCGCIKLDESRFNYFIACLESYRFLATEEINIQLIIQCPHTLFMKIATSTDVPCKIMHYNQALSYGENYMGMLNAIPDDAFVVNFMEDQFMVCDDVTKMKELILVMQQQKVDVCKATFHAIEAASTAGLTQTTEALCGTIYPNNAANHLAYCSTKYGNRFFIGCNFITTKAFAVKFWNRDLGSRPHGYEIPQYSHEWEHICMIPAFEIQAAIEDDHGEAGSCLLKREEPKFNRLYQAASPESQVTTPQS